jgi:hypothetical protein
LLGWTLQVAVLGVRSLLASASLSDDLRVRLSRALVKRKVRMFETKRRINFGMNIQTQYSSLLNLEVNLNEI